MRLLQRSLQITRASAISSIFLSNGAISKVAKYVAILILLANATSLPFAWHIYVFWPLTKLRIRQFLFRLRMFITFQSKKEKKSEAKKWFMALLPIGKNPFEHEVRYKSWVGIDDGDYNFHLSNSCYPKVLDAARFKAALAFFPAVFRAGAHMALGGTHFVFLREIPMFSSYEVRISIGAWDNKWIYVVGRYITRTKPTKNANNASKFTDESKSAPEPDSSPATRLDIFQASLRTERANEMSGTSTPVSGDSSHHELRTLADRIAKHPLALEEGLTLNCIAVSQLVVKHGRITVPPALAIAMNGFSRAPASDYHSSKAVMEPFSHANPPPHWSHACSLLASSLANNSHFLRGGWREVPEADRWWDHALAGEVEERRRFNMGKLKGIKDGMDGTLECYSIPDGKLVI